MYEDGWSRIEPLAIYAKSCESDVPWQWGRKLSSVLQPGQYRQAWLMTPRAQRAFKIFGNLPKAARKMAHDDFVSFPVRDLPKNVRDLVFEAYTALTFKSVRNPSIDYPWSKWSMVALTGDPVGIRADLEGAYLDVRVEQAQLFFAQDHREGNRVYSSEIMSPKDAATRIHKAVQEGQEGKIDYTTLGEVTAERLVLRLRTRSNGAHIVILPVDSTNSETVYLPHAQFSSSLGKELKQELARLGGRE